MYVTTNYSTVPSFVQYVKSNEEYILEWNSATTVRTVQ